MPLNNEETLPQDERRFSCHSKSILWAKLNVTQQASVSSMYNYGYELSFIRTIDNDKYVLMLLNESVIMIDEDGSINTQPEIQLRSK